ncbi:MAG: hypothetical protein KME07_03870 [Pegethrix bostrychoides GSE-TBD4-15B]|jgi:hypothetical protein|uniref:Uncharacterized protein n=1 Tax=Pegethrix bostrychoides GSE-TBD4-15B TaxID=2839662 RepID=A0A951U3G6_9CYAN|nr:hypothetical protein [Pegethrix bostrychoides GSE-TBD4-15B]
MVRYNQAQTIDNLNDQLFTDITAQQAAMVEGGTRQVTVTTIRSLEAGNGSDRVFVSFSGQNNDFRRTITMRKGSVANIGRSSNFNSSNGSITVRLRDSIGGTPPLALNLGSFTLPSGTPPKSGTRTISGSGSRYEVSFTAF